MSLAERLLELVAARRRAVLFTVLEGAAAESKLLVLDDGTVEGDDPLELAPLATEVLAGGRTKLLNPGGHRVLAEVLGPPARLIVIGAYDLGEKLCAYGRLLGWATAVIDARGAYATEERLPSADRILVTWPEEGLEILQPDAGTAIVVLTHDHKFDVPALKAALAGPACYIGALGSRSNQAKRRVRLLEAGVAEEEIVRISGPCGLDLGGQTPAETALSIIAEILAVRTGHAAAPLASTSGAIHGAAGAAP